MRLPAAMLVILLLTFKLPVRNAERMGEWYEAERKRDALKEMYGVKRDALKEKYGVKRDALEEMYAVKRDALRKMYAVKRDALELVLKETRCTP